MSCNVDTVIMVLLTLKNKTMCLFKYLWSVYTLKIFTINGSLLYYPDHFVLEYTVLYFLIDDWDAAI